MIVQTRPDWLRVVEKLKNSRDASGIRCFSADTETVDCGFPDIHITSFSVAWYDGVDENGVVNIDGAYIPVGHNTGELQLSRRDVYKEFKELLEDPDIERVFHNAKYDVNVLTLFTPEPHDTAPFTIERLLARGRPKGVGIYTDENHFDTFIVHFLLNTNGVGSKAQVLMGEGTHGLKDLAWHLLGHKMTELSDLAKFETFWHNGQEHEVMRTDLVPIHDVVVDGKVVKQGLGSYAWDDAVQTLRLRDRFKIELVLQPKTARVYKNIHREFTFVLGEMEQFGVELDTPFLAAMEKDVRAKLVDVGERMYSARPGQNFDKLVDANLVKHLCDAYDELDRRFALPKDNPEYPKKVVTKGQGRGKARVTWEEMEPASKGTVRKDLFRAHDMAGHPLEDMVRDDKQRVVLKRHPHLAHKIFNLNSNPQLNKVLFEECGLPPLGDKSLDGLWSTKAEYIEVWAQKGKGHPMAVALADFRELDKLHGTYLVAMPALCNSDGRLRTRFNQTGARTGRLSSADPNLQNQPNNDAFPIREAFLATGLLACTVTIHEWHKDDKGKNLRPKHLTVQSLPSDDPKHRWYTAMTGNVISGGYEIKDGWVVAWWGFSPPWVLFVGDYSQLEIALLAHVSGDQTLIDAVTNKVDIHAMTAQACFDEVPKHISLEEVKRSYGKYRKDAKPISFGVIYGMGPGALAKALGVDVETAKVIINDRYMALYPGVKAYIDQSHNFAMVNGYVETSIGRKRHLPAAQLEKMQWKPLPQDDPYMVARSRINSLVSSAMRQAQNTRIQGFAADLVALAMREIRRHFRRTTVKAVLADGHVMKGRNGELPSDLGRMWGSTMRSLLQIHDEMVQESHPALANYTRTKSVELMEAAGGVQLRIPLRVDAACGTTWRSTKE